ncbi:unnamed protein product [Citrullus colocynthis]|uniref:DUF4283 domain-containing protein n=1 Tax=Citrullus colocynthis TaxID=252529 RepID=A0ABP0YB97_9ROSI
MGHEDGQKGCGLEDHGQWAMAGWMPWLSTDEVWLMKFGGLGSLDGSEDADQVGPMKEATGRPGAVGFGSNTRSLDSTPSGSRVVHFGSWADSRGLSGPSSWISFFGSPKTMELAYTLPMMVGDKVVVEPSYKVLEEGVKVWKNSIVVQFVDASLPYVVIQRLITHISGKVEMSTITLMENVPVWIKLSKIPIKIWFDRGLAARASAMGKLIALDTATKERHSLTFARVCVEVSSDSVLPLSVVALESHIPLCTGWQGLALVMVDFNAIRNLTEAFGGCPNCSDMEEFGRAILDANLCELHVLGNWFT